MNRDLKGFARTAVSMQDIESLALKIKSRHVFMAFDSCFSGSIFALGRAAPAYITNKVAKPVRQFVTAGNEDETVPDRSMFKRVFVDGVQGEADQDNDGYITGSELGSYLQKHVVTYTNDAQHPQFGRIRDPDLDKGDFVFVLAGGTDTGPDLRQQRINKLLKEAEAFFSSGDLTTPESSNAKQRYRAVLALDPMNQKARAGLKKIVGRYVEWARARFEAGDYTKAELYLKHAEQVREGDERVLALRDELRKAKERDASASAPSTKPSRSQRYSKDRDGVITDNSTGLQWYVGPDRDTNWNDAEKWVEGLSVAGGGWRMPSRSELSGISQKDARSEHPRYLPPVFNISGWWVWSGETCYDSGAWGFNFDNGLESWNSRDSSSRWGIFTSSGCRVFAVRSRPSAPSTKPSRRQRYSRDRDGVITDIRTGLQWYVGPDHGTDWYDAKKWVEHLRVSGGGWRMPSRSELCGISQKDARSEHPRYLPPIFETSGWWVWSGETKGSSGAWGFNFGTGEEYWSACSPDFLYGVIAVRSWR